MDLRQTREWAKYLKKMGWVVVDKGYLKKIPLTPFSILKIQRVDSETVNFEKLKKIQKKYRVVKTYLEFNDEVEVPGYKKSFRGMLPTKTQIIDLKCKIKELLAQMKTKTKYNLKKVSSFKFQVSISNVLDNNSENLLRGNSWRVGLMGMNEYWLKNELEAFRDKAYIVKVFDARELLAVAVFLTSDTTAYYMQNGSTKRGRKMWAPTLTVWEGIKEAKRRGLKYFDFDGVNDERIPTKSWFGFTRFKEGFGGKPVYYPPALVKHSLLGINW